MSGARCCYLHGLSNFNTQLVSDIESGIGNITTEIGHIIGRTKCIFDVEKKFFEEGFKKLKGNLGNTERKLEVQELTKKCIEVTLVLDSIEKDFNRIKLTAESLINYLSKQARGYNDLYEMINRHLYNGRITQMPFTDERLRTELFRDFSQYIDVVTFTLNQQISSVNNYLQSVKDTHLRVVDKCEVLSYVATSKRSVEKAQAAFHRAQKLLDRFQSFKNIQESKEAFGAPVIDVVKKQYLNSMQLELATINQSFEKVRDSYFACHQKDKCLSKNFHKLEELNLRAFQLTVSLKSELDELISKTTNFEKEYSRASKANRKTY